MYSLSIYNYSKSIGRMTITVSAINMCLSYLTTLRSTALQHLCESKNESALFFVLKILSLYGCFKFKRTNWFKRSSICSQVPTVVENRPAQFVPCHLGPRFTLDCPRINPTLCLHQQKQVISPSVSATTVNTRAVGPTSLPICSAVRVPFFIDLSQPTELSLNHTINMYLTSEEGISLGVW